MQLSLNEDQTQILDFLDSLSKPFATVPMHDTSFALHSDELDAALAEGGFLDVAAMPELGAVTAALVVERLSRLPFAVESGASALVRLLVDPELPRPVCLVEAGKLRKPVRFLKPGATVIVVGDGAVRSFTASADQVELLKMTAAGAAIERKHHKDVAELVGVCKRRMVIGGHDVPVASLPYTLVSDAGHLMAQGEPFAACYWDTAEGRTFGLRAADEGLDVSEVAKRYGGGGHAKAAGFEVPRDHALAMA